MFSEVVCPSCKKKLTLTYSYQHSGVYSCGCYNYPSVKGILFLVKNRKADRAVQLIKLQKPLKATTALLDVRFKLSIPLRIILYTKIKISFDNFLKIMRFFGYDKNWSEYLERREANPTFKMSVFALKFLRSKNKVLDAGCGVGQLLPYLCEKVGGGNIFAIESFFFNLLLARIFFANDKTKLICSNMEKVIPFEDNFLDCIIATDSFHYVKDKTYFLEETGRVLNSRGKIVIIHTIYGSGIMYGNIRAAKPNLVFNTLNKLKFQNINIFPDSDHSFDVFASKDKSFQNDWF